MNFKERKNLLEGKQQVHLLRFLDQLNDDEKQILFSQIDAVDWGFEQAFHNDKKKEDTMIEEIDALHLDRLPKGIPTFIATIRSPSGHIGWFSWRT